MATVLIIATDQVIGGLLGQLADLAGHAVQFRRHDEEAGEAVRQSRADVVMVDAGYGRSALDAVARAAAEVGAAVVYFAATLSPGELRRFALERGAHYFALPAGPRLLRQVLAAALTHRDRTQRSDAIPPARSAVEAAAVAVAQARLLAGRSRELWIESRALRGEHEATLADCRRSYAELREAVIAYTRELRAAGVPPERTVEMVKTALAADATDALAIPDLDQALDDAMEWCLQAYYAA